MPLTCHSCRINLGMVYCGISVFSVSTLLCFAMEKSRSSSCWRSCNLPILYGGQRTEVLQLLTAGKCWLKSFSFHLKFQRGPHFPVLPRLQQHQLHAALPRLPPADFKAASGNESQLLISALPNELSAWWCWGGAEGCAVWGRLAPGRQQEPARGCCPRCLLKPL